MRVFVYFNLHRKVFSVRALEGDRKGLVISHTASIVLDNVTFKVSEAGRQRVLRERKKNVHAGVVGEWSGVQQLDPQDMTLVTYNPYKYSSFVVKTTELPINAARQAFLSNRQIFVLQ